MIMAVTCLEKLKVFKHEFKKNTQQQFIHNVPLTSKIVGIHAALCGPDGITFFGCINRFYVLFSISPSIKIEYTDKKDRLFSLQTE